MSDVDIEVLQERINRARVRELVEEMCDKYPSCKGDYNQLWLRVLQRLGSKYAGLLLYELLREKKAKRFYPSSGSTGRRYRELKKANPEQYAASDETECKRVKNEEVFREYYSRFSDDWGGLRGGS